MKCFFLFYFTVTNCFAAIYGPDDRRLVPLNTPIRAVFSQLAEDRFEEVEGGLVINPIALNEKYPNLCESARFAHSPTFSKCTAFLVGPDLLLTAGHCVNNQNECEQRRWVLSQKIKGEEGEFISSEEVIKCHRLLDHKKNTASQNDYALIRIKEAPSLPAPFIFSKKNPFKESQRKRNLYVLGHPSGLPLIHSGQAHIIDDSSKFIFLINSDTFGGNSGGPVIDQESGEVFGILTNGDLDYKLNPDKGCLETYRCHEDDDCKGESVVPIFNIPGLVPGAKPLEPVFDPRTRSL